MQQVCGEKKFLEEKKEISGRTASGRHGEVFVFELEVDVVAFEAFEDSGQRHAALDPTHELLGWDVALVFDGDIVPAGELTHGRLEAGVVEVEIAVLPGRDLGDIDVVEGGEPALRIENGLVIGFQQGIGALAGIADAAIDEGSAFGGFVVVGHDVEPSAEYIDGAAVVAGDAVVNMDAERADGVFGDLEIGFAVELDLAGLAGE